MYTPTMKTEFETIRRSRLYEEVADRLQQWILNEMSPGDKLPPEWQLEKMFGVGRSSIRDAVRRLQAMGLVEPHQGRGTVVCEVSDHSIVSPLASVLVRKRKLVAELLDVRKIIEPGIAARAARNASPEQIAEMKAILARQAERTRRGESGIEEDSAFHYCIALAANNSVVLRILDVLMDLLQKSHEQSSQFKGRTASSLAGHRRIVSAIQRRDAGAAEAAMHRHLQQIETIVVMRNKWLLPGVIPTQEDIDASE
ncbi:MAG: FadR/GntR family transcriptional regulator [Candidatus Korobacteraceae bacterium]|jgi:GntR family transcriptional repressor for pyruvate dehydrogenase complex